jgi:hypothetical protein
MTTVVTGPDGTEHEFPDETPDDVIKGVMAKTYASPFQSDPSIDAKIADVAKTVAPGLARGAIGTLASPVDLPKAAGLGVDWLLRKLGGDDGSPRLMPPGQAELLDKLRSQGAGGPGQRQPGESLAHPNFLAPKIQSAVESATGPFYEPQTTPGKFVNAAAEAIPGTAILPGSAVRNAIQYGAIPGVTGEAAAEARPNQPGARLIGSLLGAGAGPLIANLPGLAVSPLAIPAERQAALQTMRQEGVPLSAGQVTGNKPLQWMEATLGDTPFAGSAVDDLRREQGQAFTSAALRRMGAQGPLADDATMQLGQQDLSQQYEDLANRHDLRPDPQFHRDLGDTLRNFVDSTAESQRPPGVRNIIGDLMTMTQGGQPIPGPTYQAVRSRLSQLAHSASVQTVADGWRGVRNALDDAMERSIQATHPEDAGQWAQLNDQWRSMKILQKARNAAGENAAQGYISPPSLSNAAKTAYGNDAFATGQGSLTPLARAGSAVMSPLPNSGTGPRAYANHLMGILGSMGTGLAVGGAPGAMVGAAGSIVGPALMGRLLMSRAGQNYLQNQVANRYGMISQLNPDAQRVALALALQRSAGQTPQQ